MFEKTYCKVSFKRIHFLNSSIEMTCLWTILDPNMAKKLGKYEKSLSFQQSKSLWKWHHPFDVT